MTLCLGLSDTYAYMSHVVECLGDARSQKDFSGAHTNPVSQGLTVEPGMSQSPEKVASDVA